MFIEYFYEIYLKLSMFHAVSRLHRIFQQMHYKYIKNIRTCYPTTFFSVFFGYFWRGTLKGKYYNHFKIGVLNYCCIPVTYLAIILFLFVKYLHEDGRKRPKHVELLPHVCALLYLLIAQFLQYVWWYILWVLVFATNFNPLKTKRRLLYLKTQFVPHSKHFTSRL